MVVRSFCQSIVAEALPTKDYIKIKSMDSWSSIDGDVKLTIDFVCPKYIQLSTFFVCGGPNIRDLIHFSGVDFMRILWYNLLLQFKLETVQ